MFNLIATQFYQSVEVYNLTLAFLESVERHQCRGSHRRSVSALFDFTLSIFSSIFSIHCCKDPTLSPSIVTWSGRYAFKPLGGATGIAAREASVQVACA